MVEKHLPGGTDIHGGGTDLRFPHHENELAQSCAAHPDRPFVRAWAHHGMVNFTGGKMAKSVGNVLDVKQAVELHGRNALRMWFLQSHYSQPIDYSEEILEEKRRAWERLQNMYIQVVGSTATSEEDRHLVAELRERFDAAMQDDFNAPEAIAAIFDVTGRAGQVIAAHPDAMGNFTELENLLKELLGTSLGFELPEQVQGTLLTEVESIRVSYPAGVKPEKSLNDLVARREKARRKRDWETADQLREEIRARGWEIEDTPRYTRIYPAKHNS
jgi:cysteinyl-tRNA synthetase